MLSTKIPTAGAQVGIPLIADKQSGLFTFMGAEEQPSDKGNILKLRWELAEPAPGNQGKPIEPGKIGSKFFETIYLYGKDTQPGVTPEVAVTKIGQRIDGCLGTGDANNAKGKPQRPDWDDATVQAMIGKQAVLKMKIDVYEGQSKNVVVEVKHPSDMV